MCTKKCKNAILQKGNRIIAQQIKNLEVKCMLKCSKVMTVETRQKHVLYECPNRITKCKYNGCSHYDSLSKLEKEHY